MKILALAVILSVAGCSSDEKISKLPALVEMPIQNRVPTDTGKSSASIEALVQVVFDHTYVTGYKDDGTNIKTIPWSDSLTAMAAIVAAGGYSNPPISEGKIIRGTKEIPLNLDDLVSLQIVVLKPGDTVFLY